MTTHADADPRTENSASPGQWPQQRTARPVMWWAGLGVACAALTAYCWIHWAATGSIEPERNLTDQPDWRVALARGSEIGLVLASLVVALVYLIAPWRREGRLTRDGMFVIGFFFLYMLQDPWLNYMGPLFTFNPVFVNVGCPQCHVPGFTTDRTLAEPIILIWGMYLPVLFFGAVLACKLMAAVHVRRPEMGKVGLFGVAVAAIVAFDLLVEIPMLRTGLMGYPGAPAELSLFGGQPYQYPWFELLWPVTWAGFAALRYFVDDNGNTIAERGVSRIHAHPRVVTLIRCLAIYGALQAVFFGYTVAIAPFAVQAA